MNANEEARRKDNILKSIRYFNHWHLKATIKQ